MNVDRSILEDYLSKKFFNILINKSEELEIYNYDMRNIIIQKAFFQIFYLVERVLKKQMIIHFL